MTDIFRTLAGPAEVATRVRGSRFMALAYPAADEEAARTPLGARARAYFDASHHCAGWRFRDGVWRAIDAGEPSGSAGAPILAAIDGAGLVDVAVVVTRYFGGTRLGVGGLVRAYGEAAAAALAQAPGRLGVPARRVRVRYGYAYTAAVMRAIERTDAAEVEHGFGEPHGAEACFTVPASRLADLADAIRDGTAGGVEVEMLEPRVVYTTRRHEANAR